jgi:hypothetical protein
MTIPNLAPNTLVAFFSSAPERTDSTPLASENTDELTDKTGS